MAKHCRSDWECLTLQYGNAFANREVKCLTTFNVTTCFTKPKEMEVKSRKDLIGEIAFALQQHFEDYDYYKYIDVKNNSVGLSVNDITAIGELFPKDGDEIVKIEPLRSNESFGCMEDFTDQVKDERIQRSLYRALGRSHPFSNFRYAVEDNDVLQDWYHFRDAWYNEKAEEWMRDNGVDFKDGHITAERSITFYRDDDEEDDEE